jgi:hypothetical protein
MWPKWAKIPQSGHTGPAHKVVAWGFAAAITSN